jgi:hypothetical protein
MNKITGWIFIALGTGGLAYGLYLSYLLITVRICSALFCDQSSVFSGTIVSLIVLSIPLAGFLLGLAILRGRPTRTYEVGLAVLGILFGPFVISLALHHSYRLF